VLPLVIFYRSPWLWTNWVEICRRYNKIVRNFQPWCTKLICFNEEMDFDIQLQAVRWRVLGFPLLLPTKYIPIATGWAPKWGWTLQVWEEGKMTGLLIIIDPHFQNVGRKVRRIRHLVLCWPSLAVQTFWRLSYGVVTVRLYAVYCCGNHAITILILPFSMPRKQIY
jgi:hypothetical protein